MKLIVSVEVEVYDRESGENACNAIWLGLQQYGFTRDNMTVVPLELDGVRVGHDLGPLQS